MNRKQKQKCMGVALGLVVLGVAAGLVLYALKQNINLFYTPTQLQEAKDIQNHAVRLGGYVKKKSVHYDDAGTGVLFTVTDGKKELLVRFNGVLPNLFREGQGVVVTGKLIGVHEFKATEVLAKHDEKYTPPPLANVLPA